MESVRPSASGTAAWLMRSVAFLVALVACPLFAGMKMRVIEGRPVVDGVYVNGHGPYRFLVDTATTSNHIDAALARSIGLKATFRSELASSAGVIQVQGCNGVEVTLESVRADGQQFVFAGMEVVHQIAPDVQGILGQEFLSRFDYLLDVHARRLEFGTLQRGGNGMQVPFRSLHGRPVVSTSLGELAVDSGTNWVTLFGREGRDLAHSRMLTLSGSTDVGAIFSKLQIEGRTFWRGDAMAIPRVEETGVSGLLPVSVFRAVYISNSKGYVIFE